jgi:hypothetical protein
LDTALTDLAGLGDVKREAVTTEAVTKAYADLETRLSVKREAATRLRHLLERQTGSLSDVLEVERELTRLIGEIEELEGQRRYYDQRIAVSSITVELFEPGTAAASRSSKPIAIAFRRATDVLATSVAALVYLVTFLVPWLVVVALLWLLLRRVRLRGRGTPAGQ